MIDVRRQAPLLRRSFFRVGPVFVRTALARASQEVDAHPYEPQRHKPCVLTEAVESAERLERES